MGALTVIRKRASEFFSLYDSSPSESIDFSNYSLYSNQIDTNVLKKRRISCLNQVKLESSALRLQKYPESVRKVRREVHAPCRSRRFGFLSSSKNAGLKVRVNETPEKERGIMGNVFGSGGGLFRTYQAKKEAAFGTLRHLQVEKEEVVSEDSSEVVIIEDGNEVKLDERKGLGLLIEARDLDRNGLESAMVSDGNVLHSTSLDREAYKDLIRSVEKKYSSKLDYLSSEIKSNEAKWTLLRSWRKQREEKKQEELKKPQEDLLREPFVPLTEDEESEINRAMANSNRRKILVTHENSNIQITGEVLQCLRPGAWLNDEVINVYLELLKERERREPKKYLNCHFFNTFFYKKLAGGRNGYDYKAVKRWTSLRKIGYKLSECDKIFIPIHKEVHWCLAVINKKDKKFQYLDSLGGRDSQVLRVLAKYYVDEVKDKTEQDIDVSSWELEYSEDLPEQQNGFDCGVFMIKYTDFYSRGLGLHFSQENMPYFRRRTAKELLRLQAH
ncbi:ubiquitin-like-specific protease ESD4 [Silene latifolia]|uniref:ubiquitin-like-specific protease ESD4 n=1 Tax=Silene latifolia TaxID=37657 RepID=UPI003D7855E1